MLDLLFLFWSQPPFPQTIEIQRASPITETETGELKHAEKNNALQCCTAQEREIQCQGCQCNVCFTFGDSNPLHTAAIRQVPPFWRNLLHDLHLSPNIGDLLNCQPNFFCCRSCQAAPLIVARAVHPTVLMRATFQRCYWTPLIRLDGQESRAVLVGMGTVSI